MTGGRKISGPTHLGKHSCHDLSGGLAGALVWLGGGGADPKLRFKPVQSEQLLRNQMKYEGGSYVMTLVFREGEQGFVCLERGVLKRVYATRRDYTEKDDTGKSRSPWPQSPDGGR